MFEPSRPQESPVVAARDLPAMWRRVAAAAGTLVGTAVAAFAAGRRV